MQRYVDVEEVSSETMELMARAIQSAVDGMREDGVEGHSAQNEELIAMLTSDPRRSLGRKK